VDEKYLKYSIEDLIEDRSFVSWVLHKKNNREWIEILSSNSRFSRTCEAARKIIVLLEDSHENLSEHDVYNLWMQIDRFDNRQKQQSKTVMLKKIFSYAAIVVLFLSVAVLSTMYYFNPTKSYQFAELDTKMQSVDSKLILSNGNEVNLEKDNSIIELSDATIQIDKDSVIDMSKVEPKNATANVLNEVIVPFGKRSKLVLDDGTKVWLNAGSRLAFPTKFVGKTRTVFLEGEAYFEVVKNAKKAFFVNVKDINVKVLGTKFNVSAYLSDELIETVLLEGKVALSEPNSLGFLKKDILLKPNQKATYNKKQKSILVVDEPNADISIAWVNGWFRFSQQSLVSVLKKLERYYSVSFEIDSHFYSNELITGKLDLKDSLDDVLLSISDLAKAEFRINGKTVFVEKKINRLPMIK
jgi:hypothetical protein